jgi:hypothetical protein
MTTLNGEAPRQPAGGDAGALGPNSMRAHKRKLAWLLGVVKDRSLPPVAPAVATVLAWRQNWRRGYASPSLAQISEELGGAHILFTVRRTIAALEAAGHIEREPGRGRTNTRYRLIFAPAKGGAAS